jgi:hypothetical protein
VARERHLQWQKEIADLKKRTKKGRMSTQISFTPGLLTRPSTIVELPAARSFKSEIVGLNFANDESGASATPAATSISSTETDKVFDFPPKVCAQVSEVASVRRCARVRAYVCIHVSVSE